MERAQRMNKAAAALAGAILWTLAAAPGHGGAAESAPALDQAPRGAMGFFHIPSIQGLESDLRRFADESGWQLGQREHPVLQALAARTDIAEGLDPAGSAAVVWLDPKTYRGRYTLYVLPVADWEALLESGVAEEMGPSRYAITRAKGPRFILRRGDFALVTSSFRTLEDVAKSADRLPAAIPAETTAAARNAPYLYLDMGRLTTAYAEEIAMWFRAAGGQLYDDPRALLYADMFTSYLVGIMDVIEQIETFEGGLRFGPEGLSGNMRVKFTAEGSVGEFLASQEEAGRPPLPIAPQPLASATSLQLDPAGRTEAAVALTEFFLEKAPRPEPLPEPTKKTVLEAVRTFVDALGPEVTMLSASPRPGLGAVSEVTVYQVKDPEQFRRGIQLLAAAWERLADQLGIYLQMRVIPNAGELGGAPVTLYVPRMRFGIAARHAEFRARLADLYGHEGLVYRVATVGDRAIVGVGTDTTLMRETIERIRAGEEPEASPAAERLREELPPGQNVAIVTSLPLYLKQALLRGGTPEDRIGTVDPGATLSGLAVRFEGPAVRMGSYVPYEQLRRARDLLERVVPQVTEAPESLFEPPDEGPLEEPEERPSEEAPAEEGAREEVAPQPPEGEPEP